MDEKDEKLLKERERVDRELTRMIETVCAKCTDAEIAQIETALVATISLTSADPPSQLQWIRDRFREARARRNRN
jgi:hypothetical protein